VAFETDRTKQDEIFKQQLQLIKVTKPTITSVTEDRGVFLEIGPFAT